MLSLHTLYKNFKQSNSNKKTLQKWASIGFVIITLLYFALILLAR